MPRNVIETARLRLRPVEAGDEAPVLAALNDLNVTGWLAVVPHPYTSEDFRQFQQTYAMPGQTYAVCRDGGLVGVLGVENRTLGYWFAPEAQGQGLATEAARAALAAHFTGTADDIASGYFEGNARSARVLHKLGFVETARDVKFCRALGTDRPHVTMRLTRAAFLAALPVAAQTARLTCRPLCPADQDALHAIVSQHAVTRQLGPKWPWPADPAFTLTRSRPYAGHGFLWGLFQRGDLVGTVGVTEGELGYMLAPQAQGQGLASEAVELALDHAFRHLALDRVGAGVWADNAASLGLLAKFGFRVTGETTGTSACRPDPAPGCDLMLTRADWDARAVVTTPRLTMRAMTRADGPLFHDLVTRPEVAQFLYLFHPAWTLAEAEEFLKAWAWKDALKFRLALIHQGRWAGWIGATDDSEPEIFYALRPEFAGQGLGGEAVRAFTAFLFAHFPVPALTAGVFTDNPASARVLEKCGFTRMREELHPSRGRLAPAPLWVYRLERPQSLPQPSVSP